MAVLKLAALDTDDLQVISAHVQDALVTGADMRFLPRENRFMLAMKRFAWEETAKKGRDAKKPDERRVSLLKFDRVMGVKARGIRQNDSTAIYDLLSVSFEPSDEPAGTITLTFAGDFEIALDVECIEVQLTDTAAAWAASKRPDHDLSGKGSGG